MQKTIQHEKFGTIVYSESFWTGKKSISINGIPLTALNKSTFQYRNGEINENVIVTGNSFSGSKMRIGGEEIQLEEKLAWYEYVLSAIIFIVTVIWGNVVALCSIIPIIGGAIGGAISAVMAMLNTMIMKKTDKVYLKLLIFLGFFVLNFLICYLLALAFLSLLS